ncbi:MAG: hypothetical protein MIL41_04770 [Hyphomicrobiales bacterium]|jgi:hypothetical protein
MGQISADGTTLSEVPLTAWESRAGLREVSMGGTERVEELDANEVPLPPLPEPKADDAAVQPDPHAPAGSEAETKAEATYVETFKDAGV